MQSVNNRIIVRVDMAQKNRMKIGGIWVQSALLFNTNYREKSPVIAEVVSGNDKVNSGMFICCHHNHFYHPSPYFLQDDLYSIPFNKTIFGYFTEDGRLIPVCGNVFGNRIEIPSSIPLPPEMVQKYHNKMVCTNGNDTKYKKGEIIFTRPNALYDIVYNWGGEEKVVTKVSEDMIVGYKPI